MVGYVFVLQVSEVRDLELFLTMKILKSYLVAKITNISTKYTVILFIVIRPNRLHLLGSIVGRPFR